jgi:hypothetical protein
LNLAKVAENVNSRALIEHRQKFIVYSHTLIEDGRKYVGITVLSLKERWKNHVSKAMTGKGCPCFGRAIREYGPAAFRSDVLEEVIGKKAANESEKRWIAKLDCRFPKGFNLAIGGNAGNFAAWAMMTPEQRSEIARRREAAMTPEQRSQRARKWRLKQTSEQRKEASSKRLKTITPERMKEIGRRTWESATPEQRAKFRDAQSKLTTEQRSEAARRGHRNMSPEMKAETARKIRSAIVSKTPEERAEIDNRRRATRASQTPDQRERRSAEARKREAAMTPERRAERSRKMREAKRLNREARHLAS